MPSIEQGLATGEHVCYRARLHWIVFVGPFALAVVFGVPGVLLKTHVLAVLYFAAANRGTP
jgi:hypothetical protein